MNINAKTKLCIIIGDPVAHSLSPQMHNAAYEALGIANDFVHVAARVKPSEISAVIPAVKTFGIRGLTCTVPHKTSIIAYLDWIDETAKKIGAVNSIVNDEGMVKGYNTDWIGIVTPLEKITVLQGKKAAVIGAGGAARAMVYALQSKGALVTVYNRTYETAVRLADAFGVSAKSFEEIQSVEDADIVLNATTVGMHERRSPVPKEFLTKNHIVFDAVYTPLDTQLLLDAAEKGAQIIHGTEMLLHEAFAKFRLYTGLEAPQDVMRKILYLSLQNV